MKEGSMLSPIRGGSMNEMEDEPQEEVKGGREYEDSFVI